MSSTQQSSGSAKMFSTPLETPCAVSPVRAKQIPLKIDDLPEPFVNYIGDFLEDRTITTYDCIKDGAYVKKK